MRRAVLVDVRVGAIVRVNGEWGVVCKGDGRDGYRVIDFWWSGREYLKRWTVVEVSA